MKTSRSKLTLMKMVLGLSIATGWSPAQGADDPWSEAQQLFDARAEGRAKIKMAREKYLGLLGGATSTAEKIQAVSQLGRLALYEGEIILSKDDVEGRKAIFTQCFCASPKVTYNPLPRPSCESPGFVDAISPSKLGESHPAFHYFRAMCTGYWGEIAQPMEKLAYVSWLKEDIAAGQTLDTRFEGGGILRVAAGVYVNPAAAVVQLYNPELAVNMATQALSAGAYPGSPSTGAEYYENHAILANSLQQLDSDRPQSGFKEKAIAKAESALKEMDERIEFEDLPAGREPEFKWYYSQLKKVYKELTNLEWPQK
jgi:hypothetical protein